jgi:hypothetical protein
VTVDPAHVAALCPELAAIVARAELRETWTGFGNVVMLTDPVLPDGVDRTHLRYTRLQDPHYWLGEITCDLHPGWSVALPFVLDHLDHPHLPPP